MSDPLPAPFEEALESSAGRRGPFGTPLLFFRETGSTNDVATTLAERGAQEGTAVLALAQTAGRGRLGRVWFSPPDAGLYVSIVCRNARIAPLLTLAGGVAAADAIRRATALPVSLKWPNDVVVADAGAPGRRRKLAGILAEGSSGPDGLLYVVVGFGINVRTAVYPPGLARRTTSIEEELGRSVEPAPVLGELLAAFNEQVRALDTGRRGAVLDRWRALSPSAAGASVEWTTTGVTTRGLTAGIDEQGALLVRAGGRIERIVAGELNWL